NFGGDASQGQTEYNLVSGVSNPFGGGSSFKIFTSAAALEQGAAGLDTQLPNPSSQCIQPPITNSSTPPYCPTNLGSYPDPISLRTALATSPNVAFVNLEKQAGLPNVLNMAYRLGLRHTMTSNQHGHDPEPASNDPFVNQPQIQAFHNDLGFTLGSSQVSPLEMANVVATLKSGGMWCPPNPIMSITDRNGKPVPVHALPCEQVVSPQVANALLDGMSQDTVSGTSAQAAKAAGWSRPDVGKTGTTQENKSVAFVGGVNNYAVASMVFADDAKPRPICPGHPVVGASYGCSHAFGGSVAAPPYFQAFNKILAGQPNQPVPGADPAFLQAHPHGDTVPFVMLQKTADAQQALKKAGYPSTVHTVPGSLDSKGTIIGETPMGNIKKGTTITLYASDGSITPATP
ncbi:MAG: penicillin-binding protein, partial [Sciscionella sp.]|nr:penicillin-binding protein [Sciscionella sp.]